MPSAISKLEEQSQYQENGDIQHNQQWQRRLSPLKRRPSFFGRGGSSPSTSPQRRSSPERKWLPNILLPLLSKNLMTNENEKMDRSGSNSFQEAWESLKNGDAMINKNCGDDNTEEKQTLEKSTNCINGELPNRRLNFC